MTSFWILALAAHLSVMCIWAALSLGHLHAALLTGELQPPCQEPYRTNWFFGMTATALSCAMTWELHVVAWIGMLVHVVLWDRRLGPP